jgi:hypothetical protein
MEMRWYLRSNASGDKTVLQYRQKLAMPVYDFVDSPGDGLVVHVENWTPWQDVPIVEEQK